jgi:Rrf2 family protein
LGKRVEAISVLTEGSSMKGSKRETYKSSLMNVGRRVDYAVRALAYLAGQPPDRTVSKGEIEEKQDIPSHYLSKIMKDLVAGGLVCSHRGSKGGFRLAKAPKEISVKKVYECVEGPLVLMESVVKGEEYCPYYSACTQVPIWAKAQNLLGAFLAGVSIADIADQHGLRERLISFHGQVS